MPAKSGTVLMSRSCVLWLKVQNVNIDDYICITDIAAAKSDNSRAADVIKNWMRNRSTL